MVIEIDVQQSDHSGDPVVTFLGALAQALPKKGKGKQALESVKKLGAVGLKAVAKTALRSGADEVIDAVTETALDKLDDFDALDDIINDLGDGMSKAAGQMIAAQMAAEKVRTEEMPAQLKLLREALTEGTDTERVVVVIDELDRCHPDYAIAVLEAMKTVFSQEGFVFCLMVNADYLENLAQHRFGVAQNDEKYLDKFVDIRLKLDPDLETRKNAIIQLASGLPLEIPFGNHQEFSVDRAAVLAGELSAHLELSIRKTKRIILKVELALRCYVSQPIDLPLLIFLAFDEAIASQIDPVFLKRSVLTPEHGAQTLKNQPDRWEDREGYDRYIFAMNNEISENYPELNNLPRDRYGQDDNKNYYEWYLIFGMLASEYIPRHRGYLNAIADIQVPDTD